MAPSVTFSSLFGGTAMVVVAVSTLGVVLAEVMEIFELAFEEEDDPASPVTKKIWDASWQNQQNGMCAQRRLRSAWASDSLIAVFTARVKKVWALSYPLSAQWRLWSDWVDAQADLSLHWAHSHFVGFVMRWLKWLLAMEQIRDKKGIWW